MKNSEKKIARVFPRRTEATPEDLLAFVGNPPLSPPKVDEVHISVAFTYDIAAAEKLYKKWEQFGVPVKMGGPAFGGPGGVFIPGMYLKQGYTITSRGCNNQCWFCSVWKREGCLRELPIADGWNILDDNLLACSEQHIRDVFKMLEHQPHKPLFTGGLEAKLLKPWHVELLRKVKAERLYFAYDTPDDLEYLIEAGKILREGGITRASQKARCYVLIGYQGDSFDKAEKRLNETIDAGFFPYSMLYRGQNGETQEKWRQFHREWCRPQIVACKVRERIKDTLYKGLIATL